MGKGCVELGIHHHLLPQWAADREHAVEVAAQVYERIKIQQPLLLLHCSSLPPSATTQLAQSLLSEALRALNVALSVMNQQPSPAPATPTSVVVKAEPQLLISSSPSHGAAPDPDEAITSTARRSKRRRTTVEAGGKTSSWAGLTTVPYEDGYEWREYGEKKINGTSFTRSYFRCTYKDDTGCLATKHVQQKDSSDPPVFQVTYNNKHTCNNKCTATAANSSERQHQQQQPCGTARDYHGRHTPSTTSSCISGDSCCDGYYSAGDMAQQMAAEEASPGEDFLHDLELFLLCDSFKDY
ncbi:putative WRKY transcription factor 54 [Panicum miliaceum]|uniref:WRKY transcription factor 54 n=1 Tax=Panicum miliaceum TaxID=4540 RepID=A0A3L6PHI8_PANMI|nr:putative WRKY transcription factor 54 [Panicum miliaceum]